MIYVSKTEYFCRSLLVGCNWKTIQLQRENGYKRFFYGGCIFINHEIIYVFICNQVTLRTSHSIKYKVRFERYVLNMVVVVQEYHTYNGVFPVQKFMNKIIEANQIIESSGARAAYQKEFPKDQLRWL